MAQARFASHDPADEFPFAVDDYLLHLVVAIYQFRDSRLDQVLRPLGLNVSRYRVLGVLERFGASKMTELASFTAMERTTLTRIADQLVAAGLVTRSSEPRDRRQVILSLTDEGRAAHTRAVEMVLALNQVPLARVPEPERRSAARVLMQVVENLAPSRLARDGILGFNRDSLAGEPA